MDQFIVSVTCLLTLAMGVFVFLQDSKAGYARAFLSISVLLCTWIVANYTAGLAGLPIHYNDIANRVTYAVGFGSVLSGLVFTYFFPFRRTADSTEIGFLVAFGAIGTLLSLTQGFAGSVSYSPDGRSVVFSVGTFAYVYILFFLIPYVIIIRNLLFSKIRAEGVQRIQSRLIAVGFIVSGGLAILLNVVIPLVGGTWDSTKYGPLSTLVLVLIIMYAIVRYGLFDIRLAAVRTLAYAFTLIALAVLYYVLAYFISVVLVQDASESMLTNPANVGFALVLAFAFQPIKTFFDRITNRIFYRSRYDPEELLGLISNILTTTSGLEALLQRSSEAIGIAMKSDGAFMVVEYGETGYKSAGVFAGQRPGAHDVKYVGSLLAEFEKPFILASNLPRRSRIRGILKRCNVSLLVPLRFEGAVIGCLALGEPRAGRYVGRDYRVLTTIADELVIAIQNALSLEEVRDTNAHLEQRIDAATHSLRLSNSKLRKLDDAKDEFISMASHQLRTPLTSVKGYVSMILDGDAGEVNDTQRRFLTEAFESSNRMAGIIGDFLNVSRLQTGKFTLEREPVDLAEVVMNEVQHLQNTASIRGVTLRYRRPPRFPVASLDKSKVEQVVMNFIDNAIFYAPETGDIDIELFQRAGRAVFTVRDHGIGVPKAEQGSLFTKFFRATNARRKRPDGTGVGLFLAKKVVTAHGGAIIFESSEGKGSTFGFEIPLRAE